MDRLLPSAVLMVVGATTFVLFETALDVGLTVVFTTALVDVGLAELFGLGLADVFTAFDDVGLAEVVLIGLAEVVLLDGFTILFKKCDF